MCQKPRKDSGRLGIARVSCAEGICEDVCITMYALRKLIVSPQSLRPCPSKSSWETKIWGQVHFINHRVKPTLASISTIE